MYPCYKSTHVSMSTIHSKKLLKRNELTWSHDLHLYAICRIYITFQQSIYGLGSKIYIFPGMDPQGD
jgi:hypothetical protein